MYAEMWFHTKGEPRQLIARIRAEGGGLQIEEVGPLAPRIRKDIEHLRSKIPNDMEFLRGLERESGTYVSTNLVKE